MTAFYFCLLFETESFYQRFNEYACKTCPKIKTTHGSHKCENRKKRQLLFGFGVTKALNPNGKTWLTHKRPNSLPLVTYWSLLFSQNLFEHFQFRIIIFFIEKYFFPLNFISLNFELIATLIQCKSVLSSSKFGFWGIFVPLKNQSILITY